MADEKKSNRDQILALQEAMLVDQTAALKELLEYIGGDEVKALAERLIAFRERCIPNTTMDQQLAGFVNQIAGLGQTAAQVYQQLLAQQAKA